MKIKLCTHHEKDSLDMGKTNYRHVHYMSFVCTFLLNVLVVNSKAEVSTGYFSDRNHTWKVAKGRCKMLGLLDKIQVQDIEERLGWIDASAEYYPWVEYTNCFYVKPQFIEKHKRVIYGEQLQQCMNYCKDYNYIGLQQTNCSCLTLSELSAYTVAGACNEKEACLGDKYAYCSYRANDSIHQHSFTVYKKGQDFKATYNGVTRNDFANSFSQCSSYGFVSYDMIEQSTNLDNELFWLGILRRPIIHRSADSDPEYCIAVIIRSEDHQVFRHIRPCTDELPAVCADTVMSSADNKILLIATLIITALLTIMVVIAVIVLYKRRTSLRSRNSPLVVPSNEVAYAEVNKPIKEKTPVHAGELTRNNTTDDTFDHMEHHRLSQNQIPTESNYDTMQSVRNEDLENNYDVTSGTDRQRQIVVDDTAEYSHVEAVNQETKDVATKQNVSFTE